MNSSIRNQYRAFLTTLALIGTAFAVSLPATPASAYTESTTGSRPGSVYMPKVQALHYNACAGTLFPCYNPEIFVPAPYVYRSSATTGQQRLNAVTVLSRWNGSSWVQVATKSVTRVLEAGQNGGYLTDTDFRLSSAGYYLVSIGIGWTNPGETADFGSRVMVYNTAGDYTCVGRFTASCNASGGYVYLRSPGL